MNASRLASVLFVTLIALAAFMGCNAVTGINDYSVVAATVPVGDDTGREALADTSVFETAGDADVEVDVVSSHDASDTAESGSPTDASDAAEASKGDSVAEADSAAEAKAETPEPLNRCKGKGIAPGHVAILFNTPASLISGYPTYAGVINATTLVNPYPGCSSPTGFPGKPTTYLCDFGTPAAGSLVRFVIGAAVSSGDSIKPPYYSSVDGGSFTAPGEIIACKGEVEIGSYRNETGFLGLLHQWGTTERFELKVP